MARIRVRPVENKPVIELVNLVKQFGDKIVLEDLNLSVNRGEFVTLLGASGSGKTTLLRLIGGFDWPTRGEIKFYGLDVKDLPSYKRPTNTIFQDYALFPHLNVEGNIKYGLKLFRVEKEKVSKKYDKIFKALRKKWIATSSKKMQALDKEQNEYEQIIKTSSSNTFKYKRAQKWLDKSDFLYSYWETYVNEKSENYKNRHTKRRLSKKELNIKVKKMIELIGLEGNEKKSIDQLSGGMKQRVALARALVTNPQILLLDEPLSALDLKVRQKMQRELKSVQRSLGLTFIFVTHDQEEAMTISDKIAVMKNGRIEQFDSPEKIYEFPVNSWVADFIGSSNIFDGHVISKNKIKMFGNSYPGDTYNFKKNKKVKIMLRPEDVTVTKGKGFISGKITQGIYQGTLWEYIVKINGWNWKVKTTKKFQVGSDISLKWTSYDVHTMEE